MWHVTCRKCFSIYYILLHGKYPKWQCPSPTHFEVFMFRIDLSCAPTRFHICHHEASANRPLWKGGSKYLTWPCAYEVPKRGRQAVGTHMHPACLWCPRSNKQRFVYLPVDILSLKILWQLLKCCFLLFFWGGEDRNGYKFDVQRSAVNTRSQLMTFNLHLSFAVVPSVAIT